MKIFRDQYEALFGRPWPVWGAAIVFGSANVFLFAFDRPLTAADGLRNWGDWALRPLAPDAGPDILPPWLSSGSMIDIGILAGGLVAALLSREFALRVPAPAELVKGAVGGALLGIGAMLALGCNIGGFVSAVSALSLSGLVMMLGLGVGALLGLRYLLWELAHRPDWTSGGGRSYLAAGLNGSRHATVGILVLVAVLGAPFLYSAAGHGARGVFLLFGATFGFVFQRSRLCLVRAFREPFSTGDAAHTRAAALAIGISTLGFSILKVGDLKDANDWVFASAGPGALIGGLLFGVGMVIAGGCGAGALWRAGEGQLKLLAALATFALSASATRRLLTDTGAVRRLGVAVFLPATLGWSAAVVLVVAVLAGWAVAATWNEQTGRLSGA